MASVSAAVVVALASGVEVLGRWLQGEHQHGMLFTWLLWQQFSTEGYVQRRQSLYDVVRTCSPCLYFASSSVNAPCALPAKFCSD
ncbi:hypothetical protein M758_4G177900 [Ceratodon purpureus]|nr:hypothetical protein M758_4G177900 [Ceratodon purpureus]